MPNEPFAVMPSVRSVVATAVALLLFVAPIVTGAPARAVGGAGVAPVQGVGKATGPPEYPCAPLDVAIMLDTTGSMGPAINNVKSQVVAFTSQVEKASGGDYRIALLDFGENVRVISPFSASNAGAVRAQVANLRGFSDGAGKPEAWDEALATVVDTRAAAALPPKDRSKQQGDFVVPWRPEAKKMVILVTDARPGGFNDAADAEDEDRAYAAAVRANQAGIRVATVFVPNGNQESDAVDSLQFVANLTGSTYFATAKDGSNLTDGLSLIVDTCAKDADGDGLYDVWESQGYDPNGDGNVDVDLPKMGADPNHKDLFLQINWMGQDGARPCFLGVWCPPRADQPNAPDPTAIASMIDVFAKAPVTNPDGKPGITVHADAGPLPMGSSGIGTSSLLRGGSLGMQTPVLFPPDSDEDEVMAELERQHLPVERASVFTWVVYVGQITTNTKDSSLMGLAPHVPGDTVLLADSTLKNSFVEAAALVHELGHTLGLRHGGLDDTHSKPNYLSIMNYDFTLGDGLEKDGKKGLIDYSRFDLSDLDEETGLSESVGITAKPNTPGPAGYTTIYRCTDRLKTNSEPKSVPAIGPIDWNCDGTATDQSVVGIVHQPSLSTDDRPIVLTSRNDWATLTFTGGSRGALESSGEPGDDDGLDYQSWRATPKDYALEASIPDSAAASAQAKAVRLVVALRNVGNLSDTYRLTAQGTDGWDPTSEPTTVEVPAGAETTASLDLHPPSDWQSTRKLNVQVEVQSGSAEWVKAARLVTIEQGTAESASSSGYLNITPEKPRIGDAFEVSGSGFEPKSQVMIVSDGDWIPALATIADDQGNVYAKIVAPSTARTGTLSMIGVSAGSVDQGSASIDEPTTDQQPGSGTADPAEPQVSDITPRVLSSSLEVAGAPFPWLLPIAALVTLALLGIIGIVLVRRRRSRSPQAVPATGPDHVDDTYDDDYWGGPDYFA